MGGVTLCPNATVARAFCGYAEDSWADGWGKPVQLPVGHRVQVVSVHYVWQGFVNEDNEPFRAADMTKPNYIVYCQDPIDPQDGVYWLLRLGDSETPATGVLIRDAD